MGRANAAYYATRDPFADFTTAPELSQAFGEILGLWATIVWQSTGCPDPVMLAEAGPGRGTLMADALRAIDRAAPDFAAALRVQLVETSQRLRGIQEKKLSGLTRSLLHWHDTLSDIPTGPMILLANEFLDALPIRQFVHRGAGWMERFVKAGAFRECPADPPMRGGRASDAGEGEVVEICEPALAFAGELGQRLRVQGGAALFIDYGPENSANGESLQALRDGDPADPLANPGIADLTAHVDFSAIADAARAAGALVHGPVTQGRFLTRLGLMHRTIALARTQPPRQASALMQTAQRLTEPDQMGQLFKVLAVCHPGLPIPPGFEA
ncbi:MAG: class I SAM-dependent methyltransferase [Acetobacteraceae bacterium]|nr:class I SAM-dependent methyltransferase [Acetobacteraceae bacterium]